MENWIYEERMRVNKGKTRTDRCSTFSLLLKADFTAGTNTETKIYRCPGVDTHVVKHMACL